MRNFNKSPEIPYSTLVRKKRKSDPKSVSGTGPPPKVNHV